MLSRIRRVSVVGGLLTAVLIQVGSPQPTDATTAPECQVWVSSLGSSNLTFIDTWTSAPSTITLNGNPSIADFTFNRTGTKIFVATMTGLRMIDLATLGESTIASGIYSLGLGNFGAIAASPTSDLVIATTNQAVNSAYPYVTLNSETGVVVGTSSLTERSADVVFDPSGNAYAADFVFQAANPPGRIDKIDVATRTISAFNNFNLAYWEAYLTAAIAPPSGQTPILFVGSNQNTGAVDNYFLRAIDTTNVSILATVTLQSSPSGMAVSADGEQLFVSQLQLDQVRVFDATTRIPGASISVGDGPAAMAVTPDGRYLYVLNAIGGTMSKIDTATLAVVETIPLVPNPSGIAIGPAGCVSEQPQVAPTTTVPASSPPTTTVQSLPTTGPSSSNESFANISLIFLAVGVVVVFARRRRLVA
jgi:YVTN family beta-propeller protein